MRRMLTVFGVLALAVVGFAGGAFAEAYSPWDRFADIHSGADRRCASHRTHVDTAVIGTNGESSRAWGWGHVRHGRGSDCDLGNAPGGYLAVRESIINAAGLTCASRDYFYSTSSATYLNIAVTYDDVVAYCSETFIRSIARGRLYNPDTLGYVTADERAVSPRQNVPDTPY